MKTIIVATDFSPVAQQATEYAADMATAINADLVLLNVVSVPASYGEIPIPAESVVLFVMKAAEVDLEKVKTALAIRTGGKIKISTEVRMGVMVNELEAFCEGLKPYAVVMGMHGKTIERLLFGSNSLSAIKRITWPLIIIPPGTTFTSIKKIGLACDFKRMTETVHAKEIKELVNDLKAELHILHVWEPGEKWNSSQIAEKWLWLKSMFSEVHATYHSLRNENVESGLHEFAVENHLDMLIIIPKKHTLAEKIFVRSHTKHLVSHSTLPIMSMHE